MHADGNSVDPPEADQSDRAVPPVVVVDSILLLPPVHLHIGGVPVDRGRRQQLRSAPLRHHRQYPGVDRADPVLDPARCVAVKRFANCAVVVDAGVCTGSSFCPAASVRRRSIPTRKSAPVICALAIDNNRPPAVTPRAAFLRRADRAIQGLRDTPFSGSEGIPMLSTRLRYHPTHGSGSELRKAQRELWSRTGDGAESGRVVHSADAAPIGQSLIGWAVNVCNGMCGNSIVTEPRRRPISNACHISHTRSRWSVALGADLADPMPP
jgi:hypothetical protein